jgi:CelD/BcsL family acetyltransferase involved in cellulose biosynthesis
LTDLPPGAALRTVPAPDGWRDSQAETDACPVLDPAAIPAGRRRDIRQALHRAERRGGSTIETANADTLGFALDTLASLHAARWQARGRPGVLADARVAAFHRLVAPALLAEGALRLSVLRIGGRPAAACYVLRAPHSMFLYLSGFDPSFSFESPGTILLGHLIEQAVAEGRSVHFLRGAEAYKYAWGGVDRMNTTRRLVPR